MAMEGADKMEAEDGATPTTQAAKGIQAIDKTTIHRICSGQVVLTLATAVKELVENSLDAGATSVEVRLRDHGSTLLEVVDDGKGVEEHNFEGLTLKHHTSKIQDFGDLIGVKTFGFRGEALSSLCALSDLTITTRHTASEVAAKLTYDHNGKLTSRTPTARQVGTTVTLEGLFSTLPVRHKEFLRNVKKEFNKMVQVLYGYCLISTGVRITCTNQNEKGKKTVVVSTSGHPTIRDNLSCIYGSKQAASVLDFQQEAASQEVLEEFGISAAAAAAVGAPRFTLEGVISTCTHGQGRSSSDRQFYFINSRPCDPGKVMKLVNEVYHQYNRHQYPCVALNIHLQKDRVDVNVTPDKRMILVHHEKLLLATIKASLTLLYEHIPSTYTMNTPTLTPTLRTPNTPTFTPTTTPTTTKKLSSLSARFSRQSSSPSSSSSPGSLSQLKRSLSLTSSPDQKQPRLTSYVKKSTEVMGCGGAEDSPSPTDLSIDGVFPLKSEAVTETQEDTRMDTEEGTQDRETNGTISEVTDGLRNGVKEEEGVEEDMPSTLVFSGINGDVDACGNTKNNDDQTDMRNGDSKPCGGGEDVSISACTNVTSHESPRSLTNGGHSSSSSGLHMRNGKGLNTPTQKPGTLASSRRKVHDATNNFLNSFKARLASVSSNRASEAQKNSKEGQEDTDDMPSASLIERDEEVKVVFDGARNSDDVGSESERNDGDDGASYKVVMCDNDKAEGTTQDRRCVVVSVDIDSLRRKLNNSRKKKNEREIVRRFRAKISPTDNSAAEDELRKEITKDMFAQMEILGQFNLGFIITRLGQDLFIIDQHATDEKYNFETLQQTHVLQNQRLIAPHTLELTAIGETTLLDNLEIFRKNGYEFLVRDEQPVGRRVSLTTMPVSRGWEFGRSDVEELIFMLSDAPGTMCRPSRVRAMFASRACRKSVMIGTALNPRQMRQLVTHMGEIEQPWNCPHGRPTMRHLINLDVLAPVKSQD